MRLRGRSEFAPPSLCHRSVDRMQNTARQQKFPGKPRQTVTAHAYAGSGGAHSRPSNSVGPWPNREDTRTQWYSGYRFAFIFSVMPRIDSETTIVYEAAVAANKGDGHAARGTLPRSCLRHSHGSPLRMSRNGYRLTFAMQALLVWLRVVALPAACRRRFRSGTAAQSVCCRHRGASQATGSVRVCSDTGLRIAPVRLLMWL